LIVIKLNINFVQTKKRFVKLELNH